MRATTAATRFTVDSAASESRPTESVITHAPVFSVIVRIAATIDSHANLRRSTRSCAGGGEVSGAAIMREGPWQGDRGRASRRARCARRSARSEEHTSELQSRFELVFRLLLEKKKTRETKNKT